VLPSQRCQCFGRVLGFELLIIRVGQLSSRAIELDLFQRAQRDGLRAHVIGGVLALIGTRRTRGFHGRP